MKINELSWVVGIITILLFTGSVVAQERPTHADLPAHSHKAHNGGVVKPVGDYHLELVERKEKYMLYLLDIHEHNMPVKGASGIAIFRDGDRTIGTINLDPVGNTHFEIPRKGLNPTAVIINLKVNGKSLVAKFDKNSTSAMNYYCPQKCEGSESNIPGNCPKCGTALVDRRLVTK